MIKSAETFLTTLIHWLGQWLPEALAGVVVVGIAALMVAIPLSESWIFLRRHWWSQISKSERHLFLLLLLAAGTLWARFNVTYQPALRHGAVIALAGAFCVVAYSLMARRRPAALAIPPGWETRSATAPGFRVISWWQDVDTGRLEKHARYEAEFKLAIGMLVTFAVVGWILNGLTGAGIGLAIAWFLLPAVDRDSTPPKLEDVGGHVRVLGSWGKREPSETDRRFDAEPLSEPWEAQAFLVPEGGADLIEGEPIFVVQWRNANTGLLYPACRKPWFDLSPFELGSYESLYAPRGQRMPYQSPTVIVVRTDGAEPLMLARDMGGPGRLQGVLDNLSNNFGAQKRNEFRRQREIDRRKRGLDRPAPRPPPASPEGPRQRPKL